MEDAELKEIARQLYFRHKEAFDFILETRPQPEGALEPLQRLIGDSADFVADRPAPRLIRFAPSDWRSVEELNSCPRDKWTKTGRNLLFELRAHRSSDRINVNLVLGPGDATFREHVYSWANKDPSLFIGITRPMGQSTSTIYVHDLLTGTAAEVMEEEQKNSAVQAAWTEFTRDQLPLLKASISKAVEAWRGRPG